MLTKLHDPNDGPMRVAGFMSGSGSNLMRLLEEERRIRRSGENPPYTIPVIFSDNPDSKSTQIGSTFNVPVITRCIEGYYREREEPITDLDVRADYDQETVDALAPFKVSVIALAGYMRIVTDPLIRTSLIVNVHPADLSIEKDGKRKYTGAHPVRDAIRANETHIRSSTHLVNKDVDQGPILRISAPLEIVLKDGVIPTSRADLLEAEKHNQNRLKRAGDHIVFPQTLMDIAEGRYARDEQGDLYFDELPSPNGAITK
jgi:phosphoribosylglycinamide formyltransferase 1